MNSPWLIAGALLAGVVPWAAFALGRLAGLAEARRILAGEEIAAADATWRRRTSRPKLASVKDPAPPRKWLIP